jgi:DDE superfamily endonuclease
LGFAYHRKTEEGPLNLDALTGLSSGQRLMLYGRCHMLIGQVAKPGGRPPVIDLYRSIMLVVCLMRKNGTQEFTGAIFGASQSTVSRRWDLLRPIIARAVASFIPRPCEVLGAGTALVDGTITPTWNWKHIPDLYSTKAGYAGMNVQVAANLYGDIAAVGPHAVHGARHDAYAFEASGLKEMLADTLAAGDLGYVGVAGIGTTPIKRAAGCDLRTCDEEFNTEFNGIRAAIERAVATLKTWRMLSQEGGRYRAPIEKFEETLRAITGLLFFKAFA